MASTGDQVTLAVWSVCSVLLLGSAVYAGKRLNTLAGPFVVSIERWDQCDPGMSDGTIAIYLKSNQRRNQRETQYFTGNATLLEDLDDTFWGMAKIEFWSNNKWRKDDFVIPIPTKGCSQLFHHIPDMAKLFNKTLSPNEECVVRKGVYTLENTPFNFTFPGTPVFFYGRNRFVLTGGKKKETKLCFIVIAELLPRL